MSKKYYGSCLCGGVQFAVESFNGQVANCHCSMCRKFHGAAYGTLVGVSKLEWVAGKGLLKDFIAANGTVRTFCKECGSSLSFRVKGAPIEQIELAIAAFDSLVPVKVDAQIYTNYRAKWCELYEGLPVFGEGRSEPL